MMDGKEPEKRENPYKKQNPYKKPPREELPPEEQTVGKTETFATRNVKLITFLVCVAVFLIVLGPLSVWRISELVKERQEAKAEEAQMPLGALLAIADKGSAAGWKDFQKFDKSESVNKKDGYVGWTLQVQNEPFYVIVGGYGTKTSPQTIRVYSLVTGEYADLFRDDVRAFIEQNQIKEK